MPLEQQFLSFLVSQIDSKVQSIAKQTQGETSHITAEEVQVHIRELKKAIDTLFANMPSKSARGRKGGDE